MPDDAISLPSPTYLFRCAVELLSDTNLALLVFHSCMNLQYVCTHDDDILDRIFFLLIFADDVNLFVYRATYYLDPKKIFCLSFFLASSYFAAVLVMDNVQDEN